jgi:alpha-mannosidase
MNDAHRDRPARDTLVSAEPRVAYVVSHTHWDREWYLTYHRFRGMLVDVVREVLDRLEGDDAFRHFLLDGQSIILDDYLEIHPEDEARIEKLVAQQALSIGPWYILPDEFLVSAEATVRNLILGHAVGSRVGPVQKVGYMPDSFGHIAQMPQILQQAGIDSFIYTRGNGAEIDALGHEYWWQAPDGSEVLAINQCGGYCNAGALGLEEGWHAHTQREVDPARAVAQIRRLFDQLAVRSQGDVYLVSNGCDHYPPQRQLGPILDALRREFPRTEFIHTSLADYLRAVRAAGFVTHRHTGELAAGRLHFILSGVWSARMYLKQQNDAAETVLAQCLEPFASYTHFVLGMPYPSGLAEYAWKLLLENHPHDSICGCSTDEVHRDMVPRFDGVRQTAEQELRNQLMPLAPTFGRQRAADRDTMVCVANPLPTRRTEIIDRLVVLQPPGYDLERLRLFDESGYPVPFTMVDACYVERFWGIDYRTQLSYGAQREQFRVYRERFSERMSRPPSESDTSDCYLTIQFAARDLPALGHANYFLREVGGGGGTEVEPIPFPAGVTVTDDTIENDFYLLRLHPNGTFDVTDKATGQHYSGLNLLEDTEDVGDEYDYSPSAETETVTATGLSGRVTVVEETNLAGAIEASFDLMLPRRIQDDRARRSAECVPSAVTTRVRLTRGSPIIDIETIVDNRAEDHRLRMEFPTGVVTDTVISDGHFYVNHRPIEQPDGADWVQPPPGTYPQRDFTLVQADGGGHGVAVLNRGLPEVQATRGPTGRGVTLSLTLVRSVGWLSRDDFPTRKFANAGPTIPTPDAQCQGRLRFNYAVLPFVGDYVAADVKGIAQRWRVPVLTIQGVEDNHIRSGVSFLEKATSSTAISAVKRHETRDTLVVRLYNLTSSRVEETLMLGSDVSAAWGVNLLEEREGEIAVEGQSVRLTLEPHQIVTVELALTRQPALF